jgi:predicted RNase H-like HicB family nuclease
VLKYHAAFYVPPKTQKMVVAKVLDFPGAVSQGFDLADARSMITSALEDMAETYLEEGRALPTPDPDSSDPEADFIELIPLTVTAGVRR